MTTRPPDSSDPASAASTAVPLPESFLWGAATGAHQVEGNNVNSDLWALEHTPGSSFTERSGDACDSYNRWREDLDIVRDLGLNAYRFSIEWARIEPAPGHISKAELAHYRRMIEGCAERGLTPVVTIHHFTTPLWFHQAGGWTSADGIAAFRRYVRAVLPILDGVEWVCTINEPNTLVISLAAIERAEKVALTVGAMPPDQAVVDALIEAHRAARDELASVSGLRSGWTVANQVFEAVPGAEAFTEEWAWPRENQFLEAANGDDFVGVQACSHVVIGPDGPVPLSPDARRTLSGWEFYPEALGAAVRHTAGRVNAPVLMTENGVATDNDDERKEYLYGALAGLGRAISDGIDVHGYLHWSLLDNYEWGSWTPRFGLVSVDRETFARTVKPSARWLGEVARSNAIPA
jgi:beta-glucosidase